MKTQQEALDWIDQQVGKSLDFDHMYGAQCVDLVAYYCQFLGIEPYHGNARYWWESGYDGNGQFERTGEFSPGAVAIFKPNTGNGQAGHISAGREDKGSSFRSLDQNWINSGPNGSPAAWVDHKKDSSIYGYLKPKFTEGVEDMPNEGDVDNAYLLIDARVATDDEKKTYTSKPWSAPDGLFYGKLYGNVESIKTALTTSQQSSSDALGIANLRDGYLKDIGKSGGFDFPVVEQPQVDQMKEKISQAGQVGVELKSGSYFVK